MVFAARHLVGVRAATFAFAGIHGMPTRRFLLWDGLAACVGVPLVVTLGYLGALHLERVRADIARAELVALAGLAVAASAYLVLVHRRAGRGR